MTAKWAPKVPETGGEATLLHLLPSLEASRVFLLLIASSTEKYLQSAASCQENVLQTLKTKGICSSLDPCECLCVCVCVCVCVCSKLWRANKHVLSPQERSTLSFLSYHCCNRISVANNVNKIWRHLSYFIISIFQNVWCSAASLNARFYLLIMLEAGTTFQGEGRPLEQMSSPCSSRAYQLLWPFSVSHARFFEKRRRCCLARVGKHFFKNLSAFFFSQLNLNQSLGKSQDLRAERLTGASWSQTASLKGGGGRKLWNPMRSV